MTDVVGEYARLAVLKERIEAKGQRPPSQLIVRMQQIETLARARLTPQQFQAAMTHVEHAKLNFSETLTAQEKAGEEARHKERADRITRELTAGLAGHGKGLSREQLRAVAEGKAPRAKMTQAERDALFRERTRAMDPAGKGWSEDEYARRMDALADASPERFAALAKGYRADPDGLRRAAKNWQTERVEYGLQKRREASDKLLGLSGEPRTPTEADRRRASLVDAYLHHSAEDIDRDTRRGRVSETLRELEGTSYQQMTQETNPEGRPTRRAHIAAAMAESESRGGDE